MQCPVCKAVVEASPQCRRCKADLSLLSQVEQQGQQRLRSAQHLLAQGQIDAALIEATQAAQLHGSDDARRLLALLQMVRRDFGRAWHAYQTLAPASAQE